MTRQSLQDSSGAQILAASTQFQTSDRLPHELTSRAVQASMGSEVTEREVSGRLKERIIKGKCKARPSHSCREMIEIKVSHARCTTASRQGYSVKSFKSGLGASSAFECDSFTIIKVTERT